MNLIDQNGNLITILDKTKTMMPYSILLPYLPAIRVEDSIILEQGKILIKEQLLDLQLFERYDGSLQSFQGSLNWKYLDKHFEELTLFLKQEGNQGGMLPLVLDEKLSGIQQLIKQDYLKWQNAYEKKRNFEVLTQGMIGVGQGLTPSFDDLLCGLMISDLYFCKAVGKNLKELHEKNSLILSDCKTRTNVISCHMLQMAGKGLSSRAVKDYLSSFYMDQESLLDLLMEIKQFGHSSGTDILCGIYLSIQNKIKLYNKKG